MSELDQVYYRQLFTITQNITTIYKPIYMKYKHIQLHTNIFTITPNITTIYKPIYMKHKHIQLYTNIFTITKVNKNTKLIKAWVD